MGAETLSGSISEVGGTSRKKVILAIGNQYLRQSLSTLLESDGPVRGIPAGQVPLLRSAVAATASGLAITGNERRGYRLKVPKNVDLVVERPVETVELPEGSPLGPESVTAVPQVIFRYGSQTGNQDMGKIGFPRDPIRGNRSPLFRRR